MAKYYTTQAHPDHKAGLKRRSEIETSLTPTTAWAIEKMINDGHRPRPLDGPPNYAAPHLGIPKNAVGQLFILDPARNYYGMAIMKREEEYFTVTCFIDIKKSNQYQLL